MWPFKSRKAVSENAGEAVRESLDEYGRSLLHYAARDGNRTQVKWLLWAGMPVNRADKNGWSPLHFAVQTSALDCVQLLIKAGASVAAKDRYGNTPLHTAVLNSRGNGAIIAALRNAGADPNIANDSGVAPMALARKIGNYPVAQFFADLP